MLKFRIIYIKYRFKFSLVTSFQSDGIYARYLQILTTHLPCQQSAIFARVTRQNVTTTDKYFRWPYENKKMIQSK